MSRNVLKTPPTRGRGCRDTARQASPAINMRISLHCRRSLKKHPGEFDRGAASCAPTRKPMSIPPPFSRGPRTTTNVIHARPRSRDGSARGVDLPPALAPEVFQSAAVPHTMEAAQRHDDKNKERRDFRRARRGGYAKIKSTAKNKDRPRLAGRGQMLRRDTPPSGAGTRLARREHSGGCAAPCRPRHCRRRCGDCDLLKGQFSCGRNPSLSGICDAVRESRCSGVTLTGAGKAGALACVSRRKRAEKMTEMMGEK